MLKDAVGTGLTARPPHRSRRAAFPHRAPVEGRTRPRLKASMACSLGPQACRFRDMPAPALGPGHASRLAFPSTGRLPSTVSAADPRPALFEASSVLCSRPTPPACLRGFARSGFPPRPAATNVVVGGQRSPRFRRVPFQRDVVFDSGRATAPRLGGAAHVAFSVSNRLGLCEIRLFGAQYTPRGIAVCASSSSSPTTTQHSLPGDALPSYRSPGPQHRS